MIRIPAMPANADAFDRWCERNEFTNDLLAAALHVSRVTVWKWRVGQHPFNWMTWLALCAVAVSAKQAHGGDIRVLGLSDNSIPVGDNAFDQWMTKNAFTNETLAAALRVSRATVWKWRSGKHPIDWITWVACVVVAGDVKDKQARQRAARSIEDAKVEAAKMVRRARERALVAR